MATGVRSQCGELLLHRGSIIKFWDKGLKENIPGIQTDKIKKQVLLKVVQGYDVVWVSEKHNIVVHNFSQQVSFSRGRLTKLPADWANFKVKGDMDIIDFVGFAELN